jgi:polyhydroxybutyrate depolymerase
VTSSPKNHRTILAKALRIVLFAVAAVVFALAGAYWYLWHTPVPPPPPSLSASIQRATIHVGDRERSYLFYVPARLRPKAPLLIVLHGSMQDGETMRINTGYEFDRLADENGFILVYPDGYEHNWNDCRRSLDVPARKMGIDDKGFVLALIDRFQSDFDADPDQVFVTGYSNGGHMAYRLALELPDRIAGIATVAASLPTEDNCVCEKSTRAVPVVVVAGTDDPLNPYGGGEVTLFGFASRGTVVSARASAEYFAKLAGHLSEPEDTRLPHKDERDPTSVERTEWRDPGKPTVVLFTVFGGGHVIPQSTFRPPRLLGKTTHDLEAPAEIWKFFAGQHHAKLTMIPRGE